MTTTGPHNRGIDLGYAKEKGIIVSGTGAAGNATLEHIWALILATVRHLVVEDSNTKAGAPQWQSTLPLGLHGRVMGLVGAGRFGSQTAKVRRSSLDKIGEADGSI